jgi:hypothetical protein
MRESAFWNLWPEMESRVSAIQVTRQGVLAAALSCSLTALVSALSVGGYTLYNFLDALIFAIVAWRIYRLSFSWSIFGFVFFLVERIDGVMRGTIKINLVGWIIAAAFVMCYVNSIRATWFLRKNKEPQVEPSDKALVS